MTQTVESFLAEWAGAERTGDTDTLDTLLTDDFVGVGPLGFVLPKQAWLSRFAGGLVYDSFTLEEVQSRQHGDAAVVTVRQVGRGSIQGYPLPFEAVRATLTLVSLADHWQMAGIHMSFIAGTPGAPPLPSMAPPSTTGEEP